MFAGRTLSQRLYRVRESVAAAANRAGRDPGDIRIVAITKGHAAPVLVEALEAGLVEIGENRVAEARVKFGEAEGALDRPEVRRHMVGHLQRNKVRDAVELFDWIQSVDSLRLAREISKRATGRGAAEPLRILVQVNAGGEEQKHGFPPAEAVGAARRIGALPGLELRGVMAMAPWEADEATLRATFQRAREVFEQLDGERIDTLSMGMTNDFPIAIEEGSTMVRIGTALFGERNDR